MLNQHSAPARTGSRDCHRQMAPLPLRPQATLGLQGLLLRRRWPCPFRASRVSLSLCPWAAFHPWAPWVLGVSRCPRSPWRASSSPSGGPSFGKGGTRCLCQDSPTFATAAASFGALAPFALEGVELHRRGTSIVHLGRLLLSIRNHLRTGFRIRVQAGDVHLEMVLQGFGHHAQEDRGLLSVVEISVAHAPLDVLGKVGLPLVDGGTQLLQSGARLHQDATKKSHVGPRVVRLVDVAESPPRIQSAPFPGVEHHRVWHLAGQTDQRHMQLPIHVHRLRHLVHVLGKGGFLDRFIALVTCPVQALLALGRKLGAEPALELVAPGLPDLPRIFMRALQGIRLAHALDIHHIGFLGHGIEGFHLSFGCHPLGVHLLLQSRLQQLEPSVRLLAHLSHSSLHLLEDLAKDHLCSPWSGSGRGAATRRGHPHWFL